MQVLSAYLKFMTDIAVLLGGSSSNRSAISERMREVIEFEQDIAKVLLCSSVAVFSSKYNYILQKYQHKCQLSKHNSIIFTLKPLSHCLMRVVFLQLSV